MIEIQTTNSYQTQTQFNQLNQGTSVNRADLYAPHTNASKDMSRYTSVPGGYDTKEDTDDIYDFDQNDQHSDQQQQHQVLNLDKYFDDENTNQNYQNYSDEEDDDEEDDLNFDYEYGYDYERAIKERLAKVNQDFVNDSEPPKRKSILVSFDNAVTAIDISVEEQQKLVGCNGSEIVFVNREEKLKFNTAVENDTVEENSYVIKLPLNDTVQKEDPDHFANQVRIKNSMYDAQVLELQNQQFNNNDLNLHNELSSQIQPEHLNTLESKDQLPISSSNNIDEYKSSTPSPPLPTSDVHENSNSNTKKAVVINEPTYTYENSDWTDSSQTKSDDDQNPTKSTEVNNNSNKKKEKPIRVISFSSSSKENIQSPSPISSLHTLSPEPMANNKPNQMKSKSWIEDAVDPVPEKIMDQESNSNERILVEKDGVFKLMTTQEHTAYEKQKKKEAKKMQNLSLNSTSVSSVRDNNSLNSSKTTTTNNNQVSTTNNNQINNNLTKQPQASPILLLPHPPPRTTNKSSKQRPKSSLISHTTSLRTRFEQDSSITKNTTTSNTSTSQPTSQRSAHSADATNCKRRSTSARTRKTPEYALDYRSPYQQIGRVIKIGESAEERERKAREEKEKKEMNEMAFSGWLKLKEEKSRLEGSRLKKAAAHNETIGNGTMTTGQSDDRVTFDSWLLRKKQQLDNEKNFKKTLDEYQIMENSRRQTPDERSKAFKEWLGKKNKEKADVAKQDKLEMRKWSSKRRRSRKHQRLSQALELAQAYGYNSSFRSPQPFSY